jgi:predicted NBD/HSP70 family sugar kinase
MSRHLLVPGHNDNTFGRTEEYRVNIIRCLGRTQFPMTLQEIAEVIKISVPTCTKLVNELAKKRLVSKTQKQITGQGRKPATYLLNRDKFFAVGVEILSKFLHASVVNLDFETVYEKVNRDFTLEDTSECLQFILEFIASTIQASGIRKSYIIGVGIGMVESMNSRIAKPIDYFQQDGLSIAQQIEKELGLPVLIDNETRVIAIAEQVLGIAKAVANVLVVKVSRTIGMGIIINGVVITGSAGLSGNLSHTRFYKTSRLCYCGKKGCLGTAIGGDALFLDLKEALENDATSIHFQRGRMDMYKYHDILNAANEGDELSIQLVQKQGDHLGEALGNVLNLLNPELLIIDGEYLMLGDLFLDAVKNGLRKTTLPGVLQNCQIKASTLGRYLSSKAGAVMLFSNYNLTDI